jgi:hypothetical protein
MEKTGQKRKVEEEYNWIELVGDLNTYENAKKFLVPLSPAKKRAVVMKHKTEANGTQRGD